MAPIKNFRVALNEAERNPEFNSLSIKFGLGKAVPQKRFTASTLDEAFDVVRTFAEEHGQPCHAYVECLDRRKPPGFDKKFDFHGLFFNV
jgi:hypothetical protein